MTEYFTEKVKLYGAVLFDCVLASGVLDKAAQEVEKLQEILLQDQNLIKQISAPIYSNKIQKEIIQTLVNILGLSDVMMNFLNSLAKYNRLSILIDTLKYFTFLFSQYKGEKLVEVLVSEELTSSEIALLKEKLEKSLNSKVKLAFVINPNILGGLIIKFDGKMLDLSLKNKFTCLSQVIEAKIAVL
ncbi:MAG: ATP synthase F1 subunit delta [Pseudomonadota bacterium]